MYCNRIIDVSKKFFFCWELGSPQTVNLEMEMLFPLSCSTIPLHLFGLLNLCSPVAELNRWLGTQIVGRRSFGPNKTGPY